MTLILNVLRCPASVPPETRTVTGGEFSLGRAPGNDWVLPDPDRHLSKRHCIFAYRQGVWQIAGTSSNGTYLNGSKTPLESGSPHALVNGDRIQLGPYEIDVELRDERLSRAASASLLPDRFKPGPFGDDPFQEPSPRERYFESDGSGRLGQEDQNPFDRALSDFDDGGFPGPTVPDHNPAVTDAIAVSAPRLQLPDNWNDEPAAPPPPFPPTPPPFVPKPGRDEPVVARPAPEQDDLLTAFLRGAGVTDADMTDPLQTMEELGAAFRALVSGIRQVLIARAAVKSEFRIEQTMIRRTGNNPLKFSASDDDALAALLGTGHRTGVTSERAVADALTDIRLHELVSMVAMQRAARALVAKFAPDAIRRRADKTGVVALPGARKARAWDAFEALYADVVREMSDDFDSLFGKNFARAYEKALAELAGRERRE